MNRHLSGNSTLRSPRALWLSNCPAWRGSKYRSAIETVLLTLIAVAALSLSACAHEVPRKSTDSPLQIESHPIGALSPSGQQVLPEQHPAKDRIRPVWVIQHNWHTAIVIHKTDTQNSFPGFPEPFRQAQYLEFGWGDRDFFQARDITSGMIIKALLWPTSSVVHVAAMQYPPEKTFPNSRLVKLCLKDSQLSILRRFIQNSFEFENNTGKELGPGIYLDSAFYPARHRYHALNTCNTWTAAALSQAGLDIAVPTTLFADQLMSRLETLTDSLPRTCAPID